MNETGPSDFLKRKPIADNVREALRENPPTREKAKESLEERLAKGEPLEKNAFYNPAVLTKMKSSGMPRPVNIHPMDWYSTKKMAPRWYTVARMMASGLSNAEIARQIGMAPAAISNMAKSSRFQFELEKLRRELINAKDFNARIKEIIPEAIETAHEIMSNKEERGSVRLQAAQDFLDRGLGKPLQRVEQTGSKISELFDKLDAIEKAGGLANVKKLAAQEQIIDGEATEIDTNEIEETKDAMDEWIEKNT